MSEIIKGNESDKIRDNSLFKSAVSLIPTKVTFANTAKTDVVDMSLFEKNLNNGLISDINASDDLKWTFLHYAAARNNPEAIKFLVEHGANMEKKNDEGETPLFVATVMENLAAIKALVQLGANINVKNNFGTHLLFLAEKIKNVDINNVLNLEENKKIINIYDNPKFTKIYDINKEKLAREIKNFSR